MIRIYSKSYYGNWLNMTLREQNDLLTRANSLVEEMKQTKNKRFEIDFNCNKDGSKKLFWLCLREVK